MFLNLIGARIPGQVVSCLLCIVPSVFSHRFPVFELSFLSYILCMDKKNHYYVGRITRC